ncbi:hypothetical protein FRC02_008470 [Tulasnella sp. 418]|nr:hypothetical protein FRC02_008470 [Tulasnella sp. 418]
MLLFCRNSGTSHLIPLPPTFPPNQSTSFRLHPTMRSLTLSLFIISAIIPFINAAPSPAGGDAFSGPAGNAQGGAGSSESHNQLLNIGLLDSTPLDGLDNLSIAPYEVDSRNGGNGGTSRSGNAYGGRGASSHGKHRRLARCFSEASNGGNAYSGAGGDTSGGRGGSRGSASILGLSRSSGESLGRITDFVSFC